MSSLQRKTFTLSELSHCNSPLPSLLFPRHVQSCFSNVTLPDNFGNLGLPKLRQCGNRYFRGIFLFPQICEKITRRRCVVREEYLLFVTVLMQSDNCYKLYGWENHFFKISFATTLVIAILHTQNTTIFLLEQTKSILGVNHTVWSF